MKTFEYTRPESIDDAIGLMNASTRPIAGGTDLLTLMKEGIQEPEHLLDIKRLPGLGAEIQADGGAVRTGALATLSDLEKSEDIQRHLPALAEAAALAGPARLGHVARIGGDVPQVRPCRHFG